MLDRYSTRLIRPAVAAASKLLAGYGVAANTLTWLAFAVGVSAACLIVAQAYTAALVAILLSRTLDALDGAVARQTQATDRGGFLDIALDMLFYAIVPLAFAVASPQANALAAAVLLAAFIGTGSSFLAYAVIQAKRTEVSGSQAEDLAGASAYKKSFYFLGGLTEATETLIFFVAICLWPQWFAPMAFGFAALCAVTIATRIRRGYLDFADS